MKVRAIDSKGNIRNVNPEDSLTEAYDFSKGWTPEIEDYKKKRIVNLTNINEKFKNLSAEIKQKKLDGWQNQIGVDLNEQKYVFDIDFLIECLDFAMVAISIDLVEDLQLVEHSGKIPKEIIDENVGRAKETYQRFKEIHGIEKMKQFDKFCDVFVWKTESIAVQSLFGGGKL